MRAASMRRAHFKETKFDEQLVAHQLAGWRNVIRMRIEGTLAFGGAISCNSVVMWDNRATLHRGRPWPAHEARLMVRTTVSATDSDGLQSVRPPSRQAAE